MVDDFVECRKEELIQTGFGFRRGRGRSHSQVDGGIGLPDYYLVLVSDTEFSKIKKNECNAAKSEIMRKITM